ncbi:MAG: ribosomal RNA small subunit methyltransferase A [Phycisphaerales bacterium]|nr:MAG: ribosomal RNA small subunit methyltransferase A [Phycisphaerales bacterium]
MLRSAGISPNKRLGQHFLIDLNLMRLLVDSAGIAGNDVVLEVGCGTGSLTEALAEHAGRIVAVELDRSLSAIADKQLAKTTNVELVNADVLENKHTISRRVTDGLATAREECPGRLLLVANLPYNVASPVMMNLATGPAIADAMTVTVQKEVAHRMTAGPGSGDYGTLSILMHATGDSEIIRTLRPAVFWPQPQVDSAMVRFIRSPEKAGRIADMELFTETVHLFVGHRRKTLLACTKLAREKLAGIANWPEILDKCRIDSKQRPDQLSAEDYIAIANRASNLRFSS